jgi:alpha-beta hydrolase superfamily lysophospholipase
MVKQLADMEFFLAKEEERLKGTGVPIFLFGHSMASRI